LHRAARVTLPYPEPRITAALNGFFRVENLQALREVALRQVAEEVEAKRLVRDDLDIREERFFGKAEATPITERLLALAKLERSAERVVRRAWRSAQRLGAEMDILIVRDPGEQFSGKAREELERMRAWPPYSGPRYSLRRAVMLLVSPPASHESGGAPMC